MNRETVFAKVVEIAAETLEIDEESVTESLRFEDLGADSFDLLTLVTAIEDEFDLTLSEGSLEDIATVGDAVDAIMNA